MIRYALFFLLALPVFLSAQSISELFQQIPDSVMQICDWRDTSKNSMANTGIKMLDIKNGFIGFQRNKEEGFFFQAALFKGSKGEKFVLIRNQACEHCCCEEPKTFFYQIIKGKWQKAEKGLPIFRASDFIQHEGLGQKLENIGGYVDFKIDIPRYGTSLKVKMLICDYVVEDGHLDPDEYEKLLKLNAEQTYLWDKKQNRFVK